MTHKPRCPQCESQKLWKDGLRYLSDGNTVQRWLCRDCGYRFTDPNHKPKNDSDGGLLQKTPPSPFKNLGSLPYGCRVGAASTRGAKNLAKVETRTKKWAAGATKQNEAEVKGKLIEFAWQLKKEGYSPSTIRVYPKYLRLLTKLGANLMDPESIKEVIAQQTQWSTNTKASVTVAYSKFAAENNIDWQPPRYKPTRKLPFIPLESEIDSLIAGAGKKTSTILQLLKETGMRIGEACRLKWTDLDSKRTIITINDPEKGGNPRQIKISSKLIAMLNRLPRKDDTILGINANAARTNFCKQRRRIATKLNNPRLMKISFHTLRHWKATMEYHRTKDPYYVKRLLGHKSLQTTELYINLEQTLFQEKNDKFHVKIAEKPQEIKQLLEIGFEYICEKDGAMFFRKRK